MGQLSNSEVAQALEMSHSSVSRMRTGERVASIDVLGRIVSEYEADPGDLLDAAVLAVRGKPLKWVALLKSLFSDGEPDEE